MEDNGFKVVSNNVADVLLIKEKLGITNPALHSCHTAEVDGYLIEGHVPASDVSAIINRTPKHCWINCARHATNITWYGKHHTKRL